MELKMHSSWDIAILKYKMITVKVDNTVPRRGFCCPVSFNAFAKAALFDFNPCFAYKSFYCFLSTAAGHTQTHWKCQHAECK